ncbi:hypothetical protein CTEN210_07727 [Chaetoceros tenuissimus]|uniref:Uncharacterized protein n=1 Tax=Chaetoceros tenuissimus TaxID=426638 RepID=A0AAD3CS91_9STRA|nr:hypothetical protein CTEN210_07727 [Chaetoceros tenuissimus]
MGRGKRDPRMDKAVAARLLNPELSTFEALLDGGYVFRDRTEGQKDTEVLDSNGITLTNRKAHLNRRLRHLQKTENPNRKDTRMDKAVAARLLNPELSPYEALLDGGYIFAEGAGKLKGRKRGDNDFTIFDSDGNSLGQLKLQLHGHLSRVKKLLSEADDEDMPVGATPPLVDSHSTDDQYMDHQSTQPIQINANVQLILTATNLARQVVNNQKVIGNLIEMTPTQIEVHSRKQSAILHRKEIEEIGMTPYMENKIQIQTDALVQAHMLARLEEGISILY